MGTSTSRRIRRRGALAAGGIAAALWFGAAASFADSSWVTPEDLIAAIFDPEIYTPVQLDELDLTRDGFNDIRDLVCYFNGCHLVTPLPVANFELTHQGVDEGVGTAVVRVTFEPLVASGSMCLSVRGTATPGSDYILPPSCLPVEGSRADIPVEIRNDGTIPEEIETVVLHLEPGDVYRVGPFSEHTLGIVDNDAFWHGSFDTGAGYVNMTLKIVDSTAGLSGSLVGDNFAFPAGTWPATGLVVDPESGIFAVDIGPVPFDTGSGNSSLNSMFTRRLELRADSGDPDDADDRVEKTFVRGDVVEFLEPAEGNSSFAASFRELSGSFTLVRESPRGSTWEPPLLEDLP